MVEKSFADKITIDSEPAKKGWRNSAIISTLGTAVVSGLEFRGLHDFLAHRLLLDQEFAGKFKNGAFKHLNDRHGTEYIKACVVPENLSEIVSNFMKSWKLQSLTGKELKNSGLSRWDAWHGLTSTQKSLAPIFVIPLAAIALFSAYKAIASKTGQFQNSKDIIAQSDKPLTQMEAAQNKNNTQFASEELKRREDKNKQETAQSLNI